MNIELERRLELLISSHRHRGYQTDFFKKINIESFYVGENVLRPELSYVSKYLTQWLYNNRNLYSGKSVLEIGCGSGIQSLCICLNGAKSVLATDISEWAIESTLINKFRFGINGNFVIRKGDMFEPLDRGEKFDIALFNHPFFEGKPVNVNSFESSLLDNRELAGIFLENIWKHLNPNGIVLMPYSLICGQKNNPIKFAEDLDIYYKMVDEIVDENGIQQIVLFNKKEFNPFQN